MRKLGDAGSYIRAEALGCQIAVGVEVRSSSGSALFEQSELLVGLRLCQFRVPAFAAAESVHLGLAIGFHQLGVGTQI